VPPTNYPVPFGNIRELLEKQSAAHADKIWLIYYPDEAPESPVRYSYGEFQRLVAQTSNFLLSRGIRQGDRIATVAYNHADTVIQYFAAWAIGAVVVPINVGEDDKRIGYILRNSNVKLAFVRDAFFERIGNIVKDIKGVESLIRVSDANRPSEFHDAIRAQIPVFESAAAILPDHEALIVYTSGTTGNPKGVVLTQYNLLVDAKNIAAWHGLTREQRMMCVLPIHHVNGTIVTLLTPLYYGGSVVLNQKFHSHTFFERLAHERVHVVSVVPTLLQFLLHENSDISRLDLSHFRHIICGAGPLTVDLAIRFEDHFHLPIVHGYGLSETTCYSCFLPLDLSPDEHRSWLKDHGFPSIGFRSFNGSSVHDNMAWS
jgi:long-chain acyl-CoA synthetase